MEFCEKDWGECRGDLVRGEGRGDLVRGEGRDDRVEEPLHWGAEEEQVAEDLPDSSSSPDESSEMTVSGKSSKRKSGNFVDFRRFGNPAGVDPAGVDRRMDRVVPLEDV